jgi:hypothetical protein
LYCPHQKAAFALSEASLPSFKMLFHCPYSSSETDVSFPPIADSVVLIVFAGAHPAIHAAKKTDKSNIRALHSLFVFIILPVLFPVVILFLPL